MCHPHVYTCLCVCVHACVHCVCVCGVVFRIGGGGAKVRKISKFSARSARKGAI